MKEWQHGYPLNELKAYEEGYATYNSMAASPFLEVKKNTIARMLHEGTFNGYFNVKKVSKRGPINMYLDVVIGMKEVGNQIITCIADGPKAAGVLSEFLKLPNYTGQWIIHWTDDRYTHNWLCGEVGFRKIGVKISSYGDMQNVYFREGVGRIPIRIKRPQPGEGLPPEELVGIKLIDAVPEYDVAGIHAKLKLLSMPFTDHYSNYNVKHSWSALSLRGYTPDPAFITKPIEMSVRWQKDHEHVDFKLQDTPLYAEFPEVRGLIARVTNNAIVHRVRFMKLAPGGGELNRHTDLVDPDSGIAQGKVARFHVPIVTNPGVVFTSWDLDNIPARVNMRTGYVYYLDTRKPHSAVNAGETERIHLVFDVESNATLRSKINDPFVL